MPTAVETYIDDQAFVLDFFQKATMEFCVSRRAHIWNMYIADASVGGSVNKIAVVLHPFSVAGG